MNQQPESGLTTADLAHAGAPTSLENTRTAEEEAGDRARQTRAVESGRASLYDQSDNAREDLSSRKAEARSSEFAKAGSEEDHGNTPLLTPEESAEFHTRWNSVQVSFVDEPRHAVEEADGLVAAAIKRLAEVFAKERAQLDSQWDQGENVSTEDLRIALRRYRSFFGRLLSV